MTTLQAKLAGLMHNGAAIEFVGAIARKTGQLRLGQTAASLTFLTMLALVPLFSVGLWALTLSPRFSKLKASFLSIVGDMFLPAVRDQVLKYLNEFAMHVGQLPLWAAAGFVLTALLALNTFDRTLNLIWGYAGNRSPIKRLFLYAIGMAAGPLLAGAVIALAQSIGSPVLHTVIGWFTDTRVEARAAGIAVRQLGPFLTILCLLVLAYRFVPSGQVHWRYSLLGGVLAASLIELLKWVLGLYLTSLPGLKTVYGALAVIPILLIWLNGVWLAILVGAVLASVLQQQLGFSGQASGLPLNGVGMTAAQLFELLTALKTELTGAAQQGTQWQKLKSVKAIGHLSFQNQVVLVRCLAQRGAVSIGFLPGSSPPAKFEAEPSAVLMRWNQQQDTDLRQLAWHGG
jgi:membrane protein